MDAQWRTMLPPFTRKAMPFLSLSLTLLIASLCIRAKRGPKVPIAMPVPTLPLALLMPT
jgi:hypothetical protein